MERVLTPDEKLRRAEQIYYQRRGMAVKENKKTVSVPVSNKNYLLKKMIIQIVICLLIYCTYFVIKNYNILFSKDVIDKTNEVLSYDINVQDIYCKMANYINNYEYFNNEKDENIQNNEPVLEDQEQSEKTEEDVVSNITEENIETAKTEITEVSQMELDANEIKQKYELVSPLHGIVTSRFGRREVTQPQISPYHVGIDIAANTGTVIVASIAGKVVYSGELSGYGNCIQTQIDDVLVIYGHCSKLYVNKGDTVLKGQQLGEVGATGNATGPHLHFEIRKSERYVNPEMVFKL